MGLLDDLTPHVKRYSCKVATIANELEPEDRAIFLAAIQDRNTWSNRSLSNALRNRGITLVDTSISKHRDGLCSC
jgi:hypothetical protein